MKINELKDLFLVATAAGFAYLVTRNYRKKRRRVREARQFLHFQLF